VNLNVTFSILKQINCALVGLIIDWITGDEVGNILRNDVILFVNYLLTVGACCLSLSGGPKEYFFLVCSSRFTKRKSAHV